MRAGVFAVTVVTDRTDYVLGMPVTANATIEFTAAFNQLDEPARVEWLNATGVVLRVEYVPKVKAQAQQIAYAVASWTPSVPGTYRVNVTSNTTNGTPPSVNGFADFRVWATSDYVIARGVEVSTLRGGYERGQLATALADFTANSAWVLGNVSRLSRVQFTWFYPSGPAAHQASANVTNGQASDSWAPDVVGANYMVTATYLGNDTVSNWTNFPVFETTTPAANVSAGASVTWSAALSPWRVCGILTVAVAAALTIEAGVTVKFCRGAQLAVAGTLTGDASTAAPITLTSYEYPPAPGDWAGVRFVRGSTGRLVEAIVEYVTDGIVAEDSSPTLIGLLARNGTGAAVNFTRSSGVLRDATIQGFATGVHLGNATATLANVSVSASSRDGVSIVGGSLVARGLRVNNVGARGVSVDGASGVVLSDVHVGGGNYSIQAADTDDLLVDRGSLDGALVRAVDLAGSAATLANVSIASAGQDFFLVASVATLLNCSFADLAAGRTIVDPSRLIVQNYLAVHVASGSSPVAGARISVAVNGALLPDRETDARGLAEWIVVEDRVYNATEVVKDTVVVSVSRTDYSIAGSSRTVDMATSHTESFSATANGIGGGFVVLLAAVLAAILLAFLLLMRRRSREPETDAAVVPAEAIAGQVELAPGSGYAILAEKADGAFDRFVAEVRAGRPGLCISRMRPEDVHARHGLEGVPMYWLSRSPREDAVRPTNLGGIVDLVRKGTAGRPECRVLLDGLEHLVTQNDLSKVTKFVQELVDVVAERKAVLLLPVNPTSLGPGRLAILTRDLRSLP